MKNNLTHSQELYANPENKYISKEYHNDIFSNLTEFKNSDNLKYIPENQKKPIENFNNEKQEEKRETKMQKLIQKYLIPISQNDSDENMNAGTNLNQITQQTNDEDLNSKFKLYQ